MFFIGTIIISIVAIGAVALMSDEKPTPKKKKKSRKRSKWDDDPFFGTPLQKVD